MHRITHYKIFLVLILAISGCSHLRIREPLRYASGDWRMYGGSINRTNVSSVVIAPPLDSAWEYNAEAGFGPAPALTCDSLVFVANLRGEIYTLKSTTGISVGRYNFKEAILGTPVLERDILFIPIAGDNEGIVAYDLNDGSTVWEASIGSVESAPLLIGERLFAATVTGKLFCLDKKTGAIIWMYAVPADRMPVAIHSSLASDGRIIVFGCDDGKVYALSAEDGRMLWNASLGGSIVSSPMIYKETVLVGSAEGSFYAIEIMTGEKIWNTKLSGKISPSAVDDHGIYVGTSAKEIYCLDVASGAIVWRATVNGPVHSAPLVSGTTVYVGCLDKKLYALDKGTGKIIWSYQTAGRLASSPVIAGTHLIVFKDNRTVVAFRESVK
jgi:eukaryotic-like serine/threonine-protein kinase